MLQNSISTVIAEKSEQNIAKCTVALIATGKRYQNLENVANENFKLLLAQALSPPNDYSGERNLIDFKWSSGELTLSVKKSDYSDEEDSQVPLMLLHEHGNNQLQLLNYFEVLVHQRLYPRSYNIMYGIHSHYSFIFFSHSIGL